MKKRHPKIFIYIVAFAIPFIVGIIMFWAKEIAPFGNQSLLNMDLWGQYFPMYVQQKNTDSLSEAIYSHNGALGYNNWTQSAYYCGSLFLLILRFVPLSAVVNVFDWLCLVKLGLSAVACLAFLDYKIGRGFPALLAGAVSYSLCSYALAFMTQPMWTDALIYAPLVLLGLERLMREKKSLFYTLILALCIVSNFYIGYEVCIFTAVYYLLNSLEQLRWNKKASAKHLEGIRKWKKTTGRFLLYSLLAGALTAVILFPTVVALGKTAGAEKGGPTALQWYNSWKTLLQMMLPEQSLKLGYEGDNISTGILAFVLLPVFFCNRKIGKKRKLFQGLFFGFLLLSMNCNYLDYVWHGFRFPNQLPGRWTFLFCLLVATLCSQGLALRQGIRLRAAVVGAGISAALLWILTSGGETQISLKYYLLVVAAELFLLGIAMVNYWGNHKDEFRMGSRIAVALMTGITVLTVFDSGSSFISVAKMEQGGLATSDGEGYQEAILRVSSYGDKWTSGEEEFYRAEANSGFTFNSSMIGNYKGIGYYSSTMNSGVYNLFRYLGNRVYAENVSTVYNVSSPVQNGLFGIRYILDFDHNLTSKLEGVTLVQKGEECDIYENPTALPVAYAVSEDIENLEVTDEIRAIENQNDLLNRICGDTVDIFEKMDTASFGYENCTLQENQDWNQNYYITEDTSQDVVFRYTYRCEEDGAVYLEHNYRAGSMIVQYGETTKELSILGQPFTSLGTFEAGDEIRIEVRTNGIEVGCCGLNLYRLNMEKWENTYSQLSSQAVEIDTFNNTSMAGNITMEEDGLVLVTLSQDGGWSISCDGEPLETEMIADSLIGVHVSKGTHRLEFTYHLPGLIPGILISILALLALMLLQIFRRPLLAYMSNPQHLKTMTEKFAGFSRTVVALLSVLFCGILVMASLLGTTGMEIVTEGEGRDTVVQRIRENLESVVFYQDDILLNVVYLAVGLGICLLILHGISRWKYEDSKKIFFWELVLLLVWTIAIGCIWVNSSAVAPSEDSWVVSQTAWDFAKGDYHEITGEDRYFHNYPYQLGFVLYEEILIRVASLFGELENLLVIQYISVFWLASSYGALLLIANCVFQDNRVLHVMTILLALCLQPVISCTFMYGIIPGFAFSAWSVYFEIRFITEKMWKRRLLWAALSLLFITVAVVVKLNNLIILVAMVLLGLVTAFGKRRNLWNLVLVMFCVISCLAAPKGVTAFYEKRANTDLGDSIPAISWFAMGLQEAENAPGWYNYSATLGNFESAGLDSEKAAEASLEEIQKRLSVFAADKQYRNDFFYKKFVSVWNETTYQSLWNNEVRGQYWEKTGIAKWVCGDGEDAVRHYMDFFAQLVFIGVLAGTVVCWKQKNTIAMMMPLIMLGGMLYHLLAEAKSQYGLPYFVWMTAFAACGIVKLGDFLTEKYGKSFLRKTLPVS